MSSRSLIRWSALSVVTDISGLTVGVFPVEVDVANASVIRDRLLRLLQVRTAPLALDLSGTRFCDCAGVGAIIGVERRATTAGIPVCLVLPAGGIVPRVAALTGLTRRMPVTTSLSAAWVVLSGS